MKAAKQQSQELQQTHQFINTILSADPKKEPAKPSPANSIRISPIKDMNLKARFSDPPAPPPQQPLPEKPNTGSSIKRSNNERQKTTSPARAEAQMSSLNEALNVAKTEIEAQGVRLRDLEALLSEERRAREDAEERANRLERESLKERENEKAALADKEREEAEIVEPEPEPTTGLENGSASPEATDTAAAVILQQRLDLMMLEMNEMKQQMERYRERAESAEADRKSLADMIENIRKENERASSREARRRGRSSSTSAREVTNTGVDGSEDFVEAEEGEIMIVKEKDTESDGTSALLRKAVLQNGHTVAHNDTTLAEKTPNALAVRHQNENNLMFYGGPAGAIVTVVAIGVAVMAMLNQYSKVER